MFEIKSSKKIFHARDLENIYPTKIDKSFPYVVRTTQNNGLRGYIVEDPASLNKGGTLSFAQDTFTVFYQRESYFTGNKVKILHPKFSENCDFILRFITACYHQTLSNLSWGTGSTVESIYELKTFLPTKNGAIDFDFMESFISELEQERLQTLQAYLQATGLENYELTKEEQKALENYEKLEFANFKIKDLFQILTYKKRFDANKIKIVSTGHPYVVRTALNNGVKGYINENVEYLNEGNTISFGQDTATMFYQERPYFTGDKIKIMKSRSKEFNKLNAQYFITSMNKTFSSFSWGGSSFSVSIIESQKVLLPTKNNQPDYKVMELIVSAIQKLVIKDLVEYTNKKLSTP